jgi:phenylacetate-CoA ligase
MHYKKLRNYFVQINNIGTNNLMGLYSHLPIWLQNLLCNLEGHRIYHQRYRNEFWKALDFLNENQWKSYESLIEYQNERLRDIVNHAFNNVPYYQCLFRELGISPQDIQTVDDIKNLPVLTKEQVISAGDEIISRAYRLKDFHMGYTSGTTGSSLAVTSLPYTTAFQWAIWWRHRMRFGIKFGDPHVQFTARQIVPSNQKNPPFWRHCRPLNQLRISLAHLTPNNLPIIVNYLERGGWRYYAGYPSALYIIADHLKSRGRPLKNGPEFFVSGSESLLPFQAKMISTWVNCRVIDQYGLAERVANISQCPKDSYHIDMELAFVETDNEIAKTEHSRSIKIIGTALQNPAMPLFRYDTGDVMSISNRECDCGLQSPVVDSIDGRIESYVITPSGRRVGRLMTVFKKMGTIKEAQIIQEQIDSIVVRVVKRPEYVDRDEDMLLEEFRKWINDEIRINIQYVDKIPKSPNGKYRAVISLIDYKVTPETTLRYNRE